MIGSRPNISWYSEKPVSAFWDALYANVQASMYLCQSLPKAAWREVIEPCIHRMWRSTGALPCLCLGELDSFCIPQLSHIASMPLFTISDPLSVRISTGHAREENTCLKRALAMVWGLVPLIGITIRYRENTSRATRRCV